MNSVFDNLTLPDLIPSDEYNCGDGAFMLTFENCTTNDFTAYCNKLGADNYALTDSSDIEGNIHRTYGRNIVLHTCFIPSEQKIRVIADPYSESCETKPVYADKFRTALWQFEVDHSLIDCGMCYIVRCDDGSFFLIDSPHFYSVNDDIRIIELLKKISGEAKPRVSGWFFSHGHEDHIAKFNDILNYHYNELSIDAVYYNFPDPDHRDSAEWDLCFRNIMKNFRTAVNSHTEIKKIKLHTGMHFCVRNLEFDVLCTHEDIHPESFVDFNNTSTAIMMNACGTKVLFPGDCAVESDKVFLRRYNSTLKCDIVQVSHHGHRGTSPEFYRRAGAKCALFPVTEIKYEEEWPRQEANRTAVEIAEEYYIASKGTNEIELPYTVGNVKTYPDETIEDFNGVYNLWGYEYTDEYKSELLREFEKRAKK